MDSAKVSPHSQKPFIWQCAKRGIFFILGLLIIDQCILWGGNRLLMSRYWPDQLIFNLIHKDHVDAYIIGGCRAALHFDPKILEEKTGKTFFNAGRVVDGLGNVELTLNIILTHHRPSFIILVLNDGVWGETIETTSADIERRRLWWNAMSAERQEVLRGEYHPNFLNLKSGLLKYRGLGQLLLDTLFAKNPPLTIYNDGYWPRNPAQNIDTAFKNPAQKAQIVKEVLTQLTATSFAIHKIETLIQETIRSGATPILVHPPMHRYRATDEVNAMVQKEVNALAEKWNVVSLFYLDNESALANDNTLWSDVGHMNKLGAEKFSRMVGEDLNRAFNTTASAKTK
jgi:hypothetical protein